MQRPTIDLRSDTVTKPTAGMRRAMAEAEVGDDVFGDDPMVKRLEARTAELLGTEEAVYVPSGTMANQIGIGVHTQPGDELLCAATSHVYVWEAGGIARLWGVTARTFEGDGGLLSLDDLRDAIRPAHDVHYDADKARLAWRTRIIAGAGVFIRSARSPGSCALGSRAQPGDAPRWGTPDERRRCFRQECARLGPALRHRLDLLFQRVGGTDRLGPRRVARRDPSRAAAS